MRNTGGTSQAPRPETEGEAVGGPRAHLQGTLAGGNLLRVDEHMLLEVLPSHEQLVTVITLEILLARVDNHVGLQVSLLGERLVTQSTPVVLLTCAVTQIITLDTTATNILKVNSHVSGFVADAEIKQNALGTGMSLSNAAYLEPL